MATQNQTANEDRSYVLSSQCRLKTVVSTAMTVTEAVCGVGNHNVVYIIKPVPQFTSTQYMSSSVLVSQ